MRAHCGKCQLTACPLCSRFYLKYEIKPEPVGPREYNRKDVLIQELLVYCAHLISENEKWQKLAEQKTEAELWDDFVALGRREGKEAAMEEQQQPQEHEENKGVVIQEEGINFLSEECVCKESKSYSPMEQAKPSGSRKVINKLYNMPVTFIIPGVNPFTVRAILDTGATSCCIDEAAVPKEALELSPYLVAFSGINSRQLAKQKLKHGQMEIGANKFRIPFCYSFSMGMKDGIEMLIGCNFIRSMYGGLRIENDTLTFYKSVTTIHTKQDTEVSSCAVAELDLEEDEYLAIKEGVFYNLGHTSPSFRERFGALLRELQQQGYIGEDPLRHWANNQIKCRLELINPDITIQDRPLKHVTPALKEQFKRHTDALLKLGVIRPSKSRHRTMAMIVHSGTSLDPKTGREIKGKERMVFNYKTLNDNTFKDQYSLPGINTIMQKVGRSKIYSKFDLRSGFHQVAMDEESIPWTTFLTPDGLYEWLVMPFGLKNAPAIFQRKMDGWPSEARKIQANKFQLRRVQIQC